MRRARNANRRIRRSPSVPFLRDEHARNSPSATMAVNRAFLNVMILSWGFMLVFAAFQTMGNIEVSETKPRQAACVRARCYYSRRRGCFRIHLAARARAPLTESRAAGWNLERRLGKFSGNNFGRESRSKIHASRPRDSGKSIKSVNIIQMPCRLFSFYRFFFVVTCVCARSTGFLF